MSSLSKWQEVRKAVLDLCDEIDTDIAKRAEAMAEKGESGVMAHMIELPIPVVRELLTRGPVERCSRCGGLSTIKDEDGNSFNCPECTIVLKGGVTPVLESLYKIARALEWPQLWYENDKGEKWIPDLSQDGMPEPPEGFRYQVSSFACQLEENYLMIQGDGSSKSVAEGHSGYWQEVVEQMVRAGYSLDQSILIQANACERCRNVLAWEFGVGGYPMYSIMWHKSGTECRICKSLGLESRVIPAEELPPQPEYRGEQTMCGCGKCDDRPDTPADKPPPVN